MMVELNDIELSCCISGIIGLLDKSVEMDGDMWNQLLELRSKLASMLSEELNRGS